MEEYDLVVIGSGPGGEKAAVKAAYFGYKVALIEKENLYGGAGVNTGTLPSKTLKESALYLSGKYTHGLYGVDQELKEKANVNQFLFLKNYVVKTEEDEVHQNLIRHKVTLYHGVATFKDEHRLEIKGEKNEVISGKNFIIATGSYPNHPSNIPFDHERIHDSDSILNITRFPKSIAILGAGVIGLEYATIFSTMGTKVHLINRNDKILSFVDQEIVKSLFWHLKEDGVSVHLNKSIDSITRTNEHVNVALEGGEKIEADMFLFAAGRNGHTKELGLEKIGIKVDNRENIPVNEKYQTSVPHIYAVGDVIGFPALASTSMDQGRVAVAHIFNTKDIEQIAQVIPYGIYTVPEISTVGLTEEVAKAKGIKYAVGIGRYNNMPRGKIMGAKSGLLKLVAVDQIIVGVHIIGVLATELVHYGLELIDNKRTLLDVIGRIYNVPTLHELYKYAAYDALGNIAGHKIKT